VYDRKKPIIPYEDGIKDYDPGYEYAMEAVNWHRIGFVLDGSHRMLYVDDVAVAEDEQTNLAASENGLYIGTGKAMEPGSFWSGLIDDVRIYDRVISP
jgi:hypothetical protein